MSTLPRRVELLSWYQALWLICVVLAGAPVGALPGSECPQFLLKKGSRGHLKLKPIEWLPDSLGILGKYEWREIQYDFWTGQQKEVLRIREDPKDWAGKSGTELTGRILGLKAPYQVRDPATGEIVNREYKYLTRETMALSPFQHHSNSKFYSVALSLSTAPQKHFLPQEVPPPSEKEIREDRLTVKRTGLLKPSGMDYLDYPEFAPRGLVSSTHFGADLEGVELIPISRSKEPVQKADGVVRIETLRAQNLRVKIYDVITGYADYAPGFLERIMPHIEEPFREDLKKLIRRDRDGYLFYANKAIERILVYSGLDQYWLIRQEADLIAEGNARQNQFIKEIVDFVEPLYRERRNWTDAQIDEFIDYAFKTKNDTRYVRVEDLEGRIIAVLGTTSVAYGKVKLYDYWRSKYLELMGPFGSAYQVAKAPQIEAGNRLPVPHYWNHPVEVLPMEMFGFKIPRPTVPEDSPGFSQEDIELNFVGDTILRAQKIYVDWTKPLFFSTGRLIEFVKFAVAKDLPERGISYSEVLAQTLPAIFPSEFSDRFNLHGQLLVTYNTPEGIGLYRKFGLRPNPQIENVIKNGQTWTALTATPEDLLKAVHKIRQMKSEEAKKLIDFISNSMLRTEPMRTRQTL